MLLRCCVAFLHSFLVLIIYIYDGAEIAEFVGLYILSKLEKIIPQENIGLYRDDGLCVVQGSGPEIEKN